MPLSTLKEKGQIILPSSIRRQIHAEKGDMFDFQVQQDDKVLMTRRKAAPAGKGQVQTKKRPFKMDRIEAGRIQNSGRSRSIDPKNPITSLLTSSY